MQQGLALKDIDSETHAHIHHRVHSEKDSGFRLREEDGEPGRCEGYKVTEQVQ